MKAAGACGLELAYELTVLCPQCYISSPCLPGKVGAFMLDPFSCSLRQEPDTRSTIKSFYLVSGVMAHVQAAS